MKATMMLKIQNNIVDILKDIFTAVGAHNRRSQAVVLVQAARINSYISTPFFQLLQRFGMDCPLIRETQNGWNLLSQV